MQQSPPWEAKSASAEQETPCILCNSKAHYFAHNSPPLVRMCSQTNPVHALLSNFFNLLEQELFFKI